MAATYRNTPIRTAIISILKKNHRPLAPAEILILLSKNGLKANKTTVYRQLETLVNFNIVKAVHFTDRVTRYEAMDSSGHHHHLVCLECKRIEDIAFPTDLKTQEKTIWETRRFKVLQHSLEFFGLCKNCQAVQTSNKKKL